MKHKTQQKVMLTTMAVVASLALSAQADQPKPVASETNPALPASCSWSAGPDLPSVGARVVGVYFPANGKFYGMGFSLQRPGLDAQRKDHLIGRLQRCHDRFVDVIRCDLGINLDSIFAA